MSAAELTEARAWLTECEWADMDVESLAELTDAAVARGVARHYDGGIAAFRADMG